MILKGYLSKYDGESLTIIAPLDTDYYLVKQSITECEIKLDDGRTISADQRKKIYATMRDMSIWSGHVPDEIKALMKYNFIAKNGCEYFSLSDCDMTTANEFLNFLIEFCIENDIPTLDSLLDRSPDIARYLYCCLANKKCAICGKKADLHHVDAVGSGRNRKEIVHKGMHVLPLCRTHHTEIHAIGKDTFCEKYKVFGIKLDDYLCKVLKVKGA
jgi:Protein of unknown function (DUF968).